MTEIQQTLLKQLGDLEDEIINLPVTTPRSNEMWCRWFWLLRLLSGARSGRLPSQGPVLSDELLAWFYMTESPDNSL